MVTDHTATHGLEIRGIFGGAVLRHTTLRKAIIKRRTAGPVKKGEQPSLTDPQRAFLACYGEMGVIRQACKVAKVGRQTHYDWMKRDPEYRAAFELAQEDAVDSLEAEVYRRAVTGVLKPVGWYKGVAGGEVREYSDNLLMFYLKGLAPEKYREMLCSPIHETVSDLESVPLSASVRAGTGGASEAPGPSAVRSRCSHQASSVIGSARP